MCEQSPMAVSAVLAVLAVLATPYDFVPTETTDIHLVQISWNIVYTHHLLKIMELIRLKTKYFYLMSLLWSAYIN